LTRAVIDDADGLFPSAGETCAQREAKDRWREKLVDGFLDALSTGDFRGFQRADGMLRRVLAQAQDKSPARKLTDGDLVNLRKLRGDSYTVPQIAAMLGVGRTTVADVLSGRYHSGKPGKRAMDLVVLIKRGGKEIASFDTSTKSLTLLTLNEPDAKRDVRRALKRAVDAAYKLWRPDDESSED
jgi:hypothetical protein